MPSLTLTTITRDGGQRLARLLKWARPRVDEIQLFIDSRTTDDSREQAAAAGATVEEIDFTTVDRLLQYAHDKVRTDWGLHLNDDELMGENFDRLKDNMLSQTLYEVIYTPKYNLCAPGQYMNNPLLYPDIQLRLFRRGHIIHPGVLHEGPSYSGAACTVNAHMFDFGAYMDFSREEREAKWQFYVDNGIERICAERGLPEGYFRIWSLPEDYIWASTPCEEQCEAWSTEGTRAH